MHFDMRKAEYFLLLDCLWDCLTCVPRAVTSRQESLRAARGGAASPRSAVYHLPAEQDWESRMHAFRSLVSIASTPFMKSVDEVQDSSMLTIVFENPPV